MSQRRWTSSLFVAVLVTLAAGAQDRASAQIPSASVRGAITDSTRGGIPSASVAFRHTQTNARRYTAADSEGRFHVTNLEPGEYEVTAAAAGFADVQRRLVLRVGDDIFVDIELPIAGLHAQVDVGAEASAVRFVPSLVSRRYTTSPAGAAVLSPLSLRGLAAVSRMNSTVRAPL